MLQIPSCTHHLPFFLLQVCGAGRLPVGLPQQGQAKVRVDLQPIAFDRFVDPPPGRSVAAKHNGQPRIKPAVDTYLNVNTVQKTQDQPQPGYIRIHTLGGGRGLDPPRAVGQALQPPAMAGRNSIRIPCPLGASPSSSILYPGPTANTYTLTSNGTISLLFFTFSKTFEVSQSLGDVYQLCAIPECDGNVLEYVRLTNIYLILFCYLVH